MPPASPVTSSIRAAISAELKVSARGIPFKISEVFVNGGMLTLELEPANLRSSLDESMEEGTIGWQGTSEGTAEIVSVIPNVSCVNAYMTAGRPPARGDIVFVNPPRFLQPLLDLWHGPSADGWASRWLQKSRENSYEPKVAVLAGANAGLRPAQQEAFQLPGWDVSYLWGPPGTGKTHTLGQMLAAYLLQYPGHRVLLLSSTNVAVDFAVIAVDKALASLASAKSRPPCLRFGSRFDPSRYDGRRHLIPLRDKELLDMYQRHLQVPPDPAEAEKYKVWKDILESLRKQIRDQNLQFLASASLSGMTTTYAIFEYEKLAGPRKYDLVVFDEASQINKVQAMTLAPLGSRVMFAGDPKQLSPIVQANTEDARTWLGNSAFESSDRATPGSMCMLDEQWRMAAPISSAVSTLFYNNKLRVAAPALSDPKWLADRVAVRTRLLPDSNVVLLNTSAAAEAAPQFVGYLCRQTAELAAALTIDLNESFPDQEVLILTPYRAQRRTIRAELQSVNAPVSFASTIHRAQGSERRTVIVDLVKPGAEFVNGSEGRRLINVALSRAECRLVIMLQMDWRDNPVLTELARIFPITPVNWDEAQRLLLQKLPAKKKQPSVGVVPSQQRPAPTTRTLAEEFHDDLLDALRGRPHTAGECRERVREVADKLKYYRKLSYSEVDRQVALVLSKISPLS